MFVGIRICVDCSGRCKLLWSVSSRALKVINSGVSFLSRHPQGGEMVPQHLNYRCFNLLVGLKVHAL